MTEPMREGLPPVVADGARILLLGSFPSELSLVAGEYYANPRNQCWRLLGAVLGFDADATLRSAHRRRDEPRLGALGRRAQLPTGPAAWTSRSTERH